MLKRVDFFLLLLFLWSPIISIAASVYDFNNTNMSLVESKKTNVAATTDNNSENVSTYKSELLSILRKNSLLKKIQDKSSTENYLITEEKSSFIQDFASDDVDAQILMETEATWKEIKDELNYLNVFFNKIDMWAESFLARNIDGNLTLISAIQNTKNVSHAKFQDNQIQFQNHFLSSPTNNNKSSYNGESNESRNTYEKNPYEKNVFSFLYLWEKYDNYIIGIGILFALWTMVQSLIYIVNRPGR
jgi:hypothetical protein